MFSSGLNWSICSSICRDRNWEDSCVRVIGILADFAQKGS